jgi:hypothetical protein
MKNNYKNMKQNIWSDDDNKINSIVENITKNLDNINLKECFGINTENNNENILGYDAIEVVKFENDVPESYQIPKINIPQMPIK